MTDKGFIAFLLTPVRIFWELTKALKRATWDQGREAAWHVRQSWSAPWAILLLVLQFVVEMALAVKLWVILHLPQLAFPPLLINPLEEIVILAMLLASLKWFNTHSRGRLRTMAESGRSTFSYRQVREIILRVPEEESEGFAKILVVRQVDAARQIG